MNPMADFDTAPGCKFFKEWNKSIAYLPHKSIDSGKWIYPYSTAFSRIVDDACHRVTTRQWITDKEYVYRKLQGKDQYE